MEIDPAALSRVNTNPTPSTTAIPSKPAPSKASKPAQQTTPRVDLEPLYAALKTNIGDHWATYKDALSRFVLGYFNQEELSRRIDPFILVDAQREHLHNQLVCGIYANVLRDAPEAGVASWVSANDKPTSVSKPPSGDLAEQRLKREVMNLPPRMRHRLKGIQDDPQQPVIHSLLSASQSKIVPQTAGASTGSPSAAGLSKDLDIRRRYTLPLIVESHDLPPPSALADRVLPICYEEGLPSGFSNAETCAELLSTALETFVKEMVVDVLSRTRCDAPVSAPKPDAVAASATGDERQEHAQALKEGTVRYGTDGPVLGITTSKYRSRLAREEAACARGEIKRSDAGLLPCEVQAATANGAGKSTAGDLRIAWEMGDQWLQGITPWLGERIVLDGEYRYTDGDDEEAATAAEDNSDGRRDESRSSFPNTNGAAPMVNGVDGLHEEPMDIEDLEWGWQGARRTDRNALNSLLDDCLNVG